MRKYKEVKATIYEYQIKIEELEEEISCGGVSYEFKGGHTNKISSSTEDIALKLVKKKEELENILKFNYREVNRINNALNALKDSERKAIEMKYVEDYSLETIIYKMDRQKRSVLYYIGNGLKKMDKVLNT